MAPAVETVAAEAAAAALEDKTIEVAQAAGTAAGVGGLPRGIRGDRCLGLLGACACLSDSLRSCAPAEQCLRAL